MEELRNFIKDLRGELDMAKPVVDRSIKHAEDLRKLADELAGVLDDTKKYAKTALKAARVYKTIVDAIHEALAAARLANQTVSEANQKVRNFPPFSRAITLILLYKNAEAIICKKICILLSIARSWESSSFKFWKWDQWVREIDKEKNRKRK